MGLRYHCRGLKSPNYEFKHEEKSLSQVRLSPSAESKSFFLYFHMPATRSKIYFRFVRSKLTINVSTASRISSLCLFPVCDESMLKADRCWSVKYIWVLIIFYLRCIHYINTSSEILPSPISTLSRYIIPFLLFTYSYSPLITIYLVCHGPRGKPMIFYCSILQC